VTLAPSRPDGMTVFNSEEVDTKIASGWYVEPLEGTAKKKKFKTKEVEFKISKKKIINP